MNGISIGKVLVALSVAYGLTAFVASLASAFTLPAFGPDIDPIGPSVTIIDKPVTQHSGPTTDSASFQIQTPFASNHFQGDLCSPPAGNPVLIIGVAPANGCKTGEATFTPITIPLDSVTAMDCTNFKFSGSPLSANWTIAPITPLPPNNDNQSVICINGSCTVCTTSPCAVSGNGTAGGSSDNGTVALKDNQGQSGAQAIPTDQFNFTAASTAPNVIPLPRRAVDAFILYKCRRRF